MNIGNRIASAIFNYIHLNNLVYNTCWEDPRCDRNLLEINSESKVVVITSAGCNALDYLLDDPAEIHCVDINPRQNALLELKMSAFGQASSYEDLFQLFGEGAHPAHLQFYREVLRPELGSESQKFWDRHISYFKGKGRRKSFYHHGTAGLIAFAFDYYIRRKPVIQSKIMAILNAKNLEQQKEIYASMEPQLFNRYVKWLLNRHLMMCLLGVPKAQQDLLKKKFRKGAYEFITAKLRSVFYRIPLKENYFWRVYLEGRYSKECCPNYLKKEHFEAIRAARHKLRTYSTTLSSFLTKNPGKYTHFVLLDHQDWLANQFPEALHEEWQLILKNSVYGTRILMRSAAENINFIPEFVRNNVRFDEKKAADNHQIDRVGTYASVHLAVIN